MGVAQPKRDYQIRKRLSGHLDPRSDRSRATLASGLLDAALRVWDEDQTQARSQIKVAAAILHNDIGGPLLQEPAPGQVARGLVPWQARKVQEFIDASLHSKIRLQDCASRIRLSANHFSRAFKATFGVTVISYIHQRRVERAQQLMLTTNRSMSQIALSCGFADQAHFCRVFRAVVGLSPRAWRRQNLPEAPDYQRRPDGDAVNRSSGREGRAPASTTLPDEPAFRPVNRREIISHNRR